MAQHNRDAENQETTGRTVVGLFDNRAAAETAIRELKASGFTEDQIGVAMQGREEQGELLSETGNQAAQGAAAGAVSGGVVGGLIGLLGSLLIPGVGPVVVGGVLASTLAGAGIGAATGGIIGALVGMGVPEEDARHFDMGIRSGGILVTVDAGTRTAEALAILDRNGVDLGPSRQRFKTDVSNAATAGTAGTAGLASAVYGDLGVADATMGGAGGADAGIGSVSSAGIAGAGVGPADVASGSSTGTRGFPSKQQRYTGRERRSRNDPNYAGPERRLVGV